jgi:transposase
VDRERVWAIEDCRHVSGALERFLLKRGEQVVRVAPKLVAGARRSARERGKSDAIDAVGIGRAALREGLDTLPIARLAGPELDVRLLVDHRERLVAQRTQLINDLRWHLHDLWPELEIPARVPTAGRWQDRVGGRLGRAEQTARVRIARDELRRVRELTRSIDALQRELAALVAAMAQPLLNERGCGVLTAAKLIGEIAGIQRFASDAKLARLAGSAPIPASSGHTTRHRLDRGGNRQLNCALHRLAVTKARLDPDTAAYLARKQAPRQEPPRSAALPQAPPRPPRLATAAAARRPRHSHFLTAPGPTHPLHHDPLQHALQPLRVDIDGMCRGLSWRTGRDLLSSSAERVRAGV